MAYNRVNATDVSDLLNQVAGFLTGQGWTVANSLSGGYGDGADRQLCLTAPSGNYFFNMYADYDSKYVFTSVSSAVGNVANTAGAQPDESRLSITNIPSNNYQNVFMFAHGDSFYCVVEWAVSYFRHFSVGVLDKTGGDGAWQGGQFSVGTWWDQTGGPFNYINSPTSNYHCTLWDGRGTDRSPSSHDNIVRFIDGGTIYDRKFARNGYADSADNNMAVGGMREGGLFYWPTIYSESQVIGRTTLVPIYVVARNVADTRYHGLGTVANVRTLRIVNHNPKDTMTIGADTWHIFPLVRKNGPTGEENSSVYGIAYKE